MNIDRILAGLLVGLSLSLAACDQPVADTPAAGPGEQEAADVAQGGGDAAADSGPDEAARAAYLAAYADLAHQGYADSLAAAEELTAAIEALLEDPTDGRLAAARRAWVAGNRIYSRTEVLRFYGGPIDHPENGPEGRINAWPLDEAYLDYVEGREDAGIIQAVATHPELSADLLLSLNEQGGEANVSTGWHAIEFLLWGQDQAADGPGDRPLEDLAPGGPRQADRRREALRLLAAQLEADLASLVDAWAPDQAANYRAAFLALPADEALGKVLTGMGSLSGAELMGERLTVPFSTQDQEEEINCFSDSTVEALLGDQEGIAEAWWGAQEAEGEHSLSQLLTAEGHEALSGDLEQAIAAATEAVGAIPTPFDQAILGIPGAKGPAAIEAALAALERQTELLGQAAVALGVEVQAAE